MATVCLFIIIPSSSALVLEIVKTWITKTLTLSLAFLTKQTLCLSCNKYKLRRFYIFIGVFRRALNTTQSPFFWVLQNLSHYMGRQAGNGDTVLVKSGDMKSRRQTLPWWLRRVQTTENIIYWPRWVYNGSPNFLTFLQSFSDKKPRIILNQGFCGTDVGLDNVI